MSLFSRGIAEIAFLYGHGYGVGFPGVDVERLHRRLDVRTGPHRGHGGLRRLRPPRIRPVPRLLHAERRRSQARGGRVRARSSSRGPVGQQRGGPRPEGELTYDLASSSFKMHLFGNGIRSEAVHRRHDCRSDHVRSWVRRTLRSRSRSHRWRRTLRKGRRAHLRLRRLGDELERHRRPSTTCEISTGSRSGPTRSREVDINVALGQTKVERRSDQVTVTRLTA